MNTSTVVTTFGVILAALLTAAGAIGTWAALRVGRNAETLKNYRDNAESWKEKAEVQEGEIRELKAENSQLKSEIADLRGQVTVLGSLVRSAIAELVASPAAQHKEVLERLDKLSKHFGGGGL